MRSLPVKGNFIVNPQPDQHRYRHSNRQPRYIDDGMQLAPGKIPQRSFEVIS
jgi:hypothetical protein